MCEIKYRLFGKELQIMYSWEEILDFHSLRDTLKHGGNEDRYYSSLMQYTGEKDVYGNDIYEGDIVYQEFYDRISEKHGFTGVVKQREGSWWICNGIDHAELLWSELNLNHIKGNIYENRELLENWTK
ncbi:YopX family protein [Bacillus thuringiensis]|nr:YopX family protein [Bacillus thuringiensis]